MHAHSHDQFDAKQATNPKPFFYSFSCCSLPLASHVPSHIQTPRPSFINIILPCPCLYPLLTCLCKRFILHVNKNSCICHTYTPHTYFQSSACMKQNPHPSLIKCMQHPHIMHKLTPCNKLFPMCQAMHTPVATVQ